MEQEEITHDAEVEIEDGEFQESDEVAEPEKDWQAEAFKYKRLLEKATKPKPQSTLPTQSPKADYDDLFEVATAIKGLETDELSEMKAEAKSLGVNPVAFIKSKGGQAFLKELRTQKSAEATTPAPSRRGVPMGGTKSSKDVISDPNADASAKQAAFEARMKAVRK